MKHQIEPTGPRFIDRADGVEKAIHKWGLNGYWLFRFHPDGHWHCVHRLTDSAEHVAFMERVLLANLDCQDGDAVEVFRDGPDGPKVIVVSEWTKWEPQRFEGATALAALIEAYDAKQLTIR